MVIHVPFPRPWGGDRIVAINFDLWRRLSKPQRDLILLRAVAWLGAVKWLKLGWPQVVATAGILGSIVEILQADAVGLVMASSLSGLALMQVWRDNHSSDLEIDADQMALRVALRRGYSEPDAAHHLLTAIESISVLEQRTGLSFTDLLRCQNLRTIAGVASAQPLSPKA